MSTPNCTWIASDILHKRFAVLTAPLLYPACASAQTDTMHRGSALVSVDDRAFEVQQKCGNPDHRDDVGYTLGSYDRREFKVEEQVYGPHNGVTYILTFEANKLERIGFKR